MAKMKSDTPIDYAIFQLSPKRSRCELFVSSDGSMEKLASGLLKPFVAHLRVAEEQVASAAQSVKLEVGRRRNAEVWFTKGTLERFVRFVSTPEVLELVNTFDAEMSQLEAARRIYSQGAGDHLSGGGGSSADDDTKKELLRAIDVRLVAVQQDLSTACARAAAAGFDIDTVSELQLFADRFGAHRLNEACDKFLSLCERRPNLTNPWKPGPEDRAVRASYGSDMSIDDDPPSPQPRQEPTTSKQSNPPSIAFPIRRTFSREPSVERDDGNRNKANNTVTEKDDKDESSTTPESIQLSQPARRLSVQDRISLFENKQKETSGGKPKPSELRRLSSDVSLSSAAAEKAVLRRWSGASDMSIDLSAEKKDVDSPSYTPSSMPVSQENKVLNSNDNTAKNSSIVKPEIKVIPSISRVSDGGLREGSFNRSEQFFESSKSNSNSGSGETDGLKDEERGKIQSGSFISRAEHQENSEENFRTLPGGKADGVFGTRNQGKLKGSHSCGELSGPHTHIAAERDQGSSLTQSRPSGSKGDGQVEISNPGDNSESRDESATQTRFNSTRKAVGESGVFEAVAGSRIREAFAARYKGVEGDSLPTQQEIKSFGKAEVVEKKEPHASKKVSSGSVSNSEDSGSQKMKFGKQGSAAALSKKVQIQRDEISFSGNTRTSFAREAQEGFDSFSTPPPDQAQRMRPSKGNQELNDELKMKANELEKLFAEHKLRAPGDQSNSARKGKTEDTRREATINLHYKKPVEDITPQVFDGYQWAEPTESSKNKTNFNASSPVKTIDNQNHGDTLNKNFSELSVSEGSRGKVYNRYMQKRDAKLREEWSSKRVEKEARLKSMQDILERNRSEMKAKISGSADKQDSISSSRRRAERLQSYNSRSIMIREQQHLDFGDSEDVDEDEALDRVCEDRAIIYGTSFENDMSRGAQGKKILPNNRSLLSSTPRTSAAPVPRSATKTSTINSGKRRMQPENPLAQSVPNYSDLRKENTKPSSGGSKVTRLQVRNYSRSKSISDEATLDKSTIDKEDKSHRSQSSRKSSAFPNECEEMSYLDSDGVVLTPIKFEEEVPKSATTKPFLKKGSRTGFVARASIARQKASVGSNPIKDIEGNDYLATGPDDVVSGVKDEGDEDFETLKTEVNKILDNGEQRIELESDKFRNSGSENSDGTPTFSHVDHVLGSQLPFEISSNFLPVESMQDWPGESPMSWISRNQNPFSYPHEMSDVDASVDSPVGSPASWNSHSLNQMEADAVRMRKKWGTAQKPMLVTNSSNHLPRKDMTRGFKRFLKFGRKNRASESLVDWISATTSEGDDDTEDGRDLANRSSEDLRKSRMGFSQAQASDYGFSESELFGESVQSSDSSIPAPPSNFKLRDDHMSGSSIKGEIMKFYSLCLSYLFKHDMLQSL
ncbi:hypothetical protein ACJIZ3_021106 [Penstemon smallii]|uniref:COP1-interacting protein 7 n=1 Tax=Penstemon smallii TaxID=265156 RepID=A0ABD3SKI8_9LAMI